ncbi:winged helix-turn-helix domain-containing protein [Pseudomonas sp. MPFS]|nr:winged helix-turn-helix domain-containing protein [Pseudomonas sp. MPFS]
MDSPLPSCRSKSCWVGSEIAIPQICHSRPGNVLILNVIFQDTEFDPGDGRVELQVSKRLVASKLGIQPETFSRTLHRLVDEGLISMQRRSIQILALDRLADYPG